jgi:isopentenyldiphosphate isomerase
MRSQPGFAQDPGELFDIVRADGTSTGRSKPRAEVHRDGDWHRALHLWVAGTDPNGKPFLIFQQRAAGKDTWPNHLDVTVGGHLGAGEEVADALREVHEEIGIDPDPAAIIPLGTRVCANESGGVLDREVQSVLLLRDDRSLDAYRPNPAEVTALIRFPIDQLLDFLSGDAEAIAGVALGHDGNTEAALITRDRFIPNVDRYFYRVAIAARSALRGERHVAV